jgi:putative phosphoribosyl transferase
MIFLNRTDAGRKLAGRLAAYANRADVIVLALPRGGVPVAFEVARALHAPLDVFLSRKLGVPGQEELAFGALASGGVRVLDQDLIRQVGISPEEVARVTKKAKKELERRESVYRAGRPPLRVEGLTALLVDDGIATGSSIRAGAKALREMKPARIVIAVPVAPASTCKRLRDEVDELVCLHMPEMFFAIGQFYEDFSQLSDEEVIDFLRQSAQSAVQKTA